MNKEKSVKLAKILKAVKENSDTVTEALGNIEIVKHTLLRFMFSDVDIELEKRLADDMLEK